jgi:hypothetical protein
MVPDGDRTIGGVSRRRDVELVGVVQGVLEVGECHLILLQALYR